MQTTVCKIILKAKELILLANKQSFSINEVRILGWKLRLSRYLDYNLRTLLNVIFLNSYANLLLRVYKTENTENVIIHV